jgi:hypothetical protein
MMTEVRCGVCRDAVEEKLEWLILEHLVPVHCRAGDASLSNVEIGTLSAIVFRSQIPFCSEGDAVTLEGLALLELRGVAGAVSPN